MESFKVQMCLTKVHMDSSRVQMHSLKVQMQLIKVQMDFNKVQVYPTGAEAENLDEYENECIIIFQN